MRWTPDHADWQAGQEAKVRRLVVELKDVPQGGESIVEDSMSSPLGMPWNSTAGRKPRCWKYPGAF